MAHHFNIDMYTNFLIANGNRYSGVEVSKVAVKNDCTPSHDTVSRWLRSQDYEPSRLWEYIQNEVDRSHSLIVDDTTLDKTWSPHNEPTSFHWSGNKHKAIRGISLVNLLSTNGTEYLPIDYRVYEGKESDVTKNDHFIAMLNTAKERRFAPDYVMGDSWYASLENLKHIVSLGWKFIFGIKENRLVNLEQGKYMPIHALDWTKKRVHKVWLKGFGFVLVAQIVFKNGDIHYLVTNDLTLTEYGTLSEESKSVGKLRSSIGASNRRLGLRSVTPSKQRRNAPTSLHALWRSLGWSLSDSEPG
jgi:putative transposase